MELAAIAFFAMPDIEALSRQRQSSRIGGPDLPAGSRGRTRNRKSKGSALGRALSRTRSGERDETISILTLCQQAPGRACLGNGRDRLRRASSVPGRGSVHADAPGGSIGSFSAASIPRRNRAREALICPSLQISFETEEEGCGMASASVAGIWTKDGEKSCGQACRAGPGSK